MCCTKISELSLNNTEMLIPLPVSTFREMELKGSDRLCRRSKESKKNEVKGKTGHRESGKMKTEARNEEQTTFQIKIKH